MFGSQILRGHYELVEICINVCRIIKCEYASRTKKKITYIQRSSKDRENRPDHLTGAELYPTVE